MAFRAGDGLVALGAYKERRRIRRAQRIPLHEVRKVLMRWCAGDSLVAALNDLAELDTATRAPRKAPKKGGGRG